MNNPISGQIHSIETFGAVDGPGVRFVVFLQGCPLKCLFCHNPDSWDTKSGKTMTSEKLTDTIKQYRNFIKRGGVTFSGGEPLLQHEFVLDTIKRCKAYGIHTAIDTSGAMPLDAVKETIDASDMLLLDIKSLDDDLCKKITGMSNRNALAILDYCEMTHKPVWIRHVMVPGLTLVENKLEELAKYLKDFKCIEKVELLPFHKMGEYKWEQLKRHYELKDTPSPSKQEIAMAKEIFKKYNLPL